MNKQYYTTAEGLIIPDRYVNRHHLIFRERDYKTPVERAFRGMGGFIIKMTIDAHADLHAETEPPIKPHTELMRLLIANQRGKEHVETEERLNLTVDYLNDIVFLEGKHAEDAESLLGNLNRQRTYVEIGRVTLLQQ